MEELKKRIKAVEDTQVEHRIFLTKMKATDDAIFEKLRGITKAINAHKENFINYDKEEIKKYGNIDKRLQKIERIMYMGVGAGLLVEFLLKGQ